MLEIIRDENLPVRKVVVVASSQAVYREGAANCPRHGLVFPETRPTAQLAAGDFSVRCPKPGCGEPSAPTATAEEAPTGGETVYAASTPNRMYPTTRSKALPRPLVILRCSRRLSQPRRIP
jgi:dTDP-L-rhamnose 4-epimerase